jgi:hypothetical protein
MSSHFGYSTIQVVGSEFAPNAKGLAFAWGGARLGVDQVNPTFGQRKVDRKFKELASKPEHFPPVQFLNSCSLQPIQKAWLLAWGGVLRVDSLSKA